MSAVCVAREMRPSTPVLAAIAVGAALLAAAPAAAQNFGAGGARYGCACLTNETGVNINFRYAFGSNPLKKATMGANRRQWICYDYGNGPRTSPPLKFELDVDMGKGNAWTTYALTRVQSNAKDCNAIGRVGQFGVRYRPNTNRQFIEVYKK